MKSPNTNIGSTTKKIEDEAVEILAKAQLSKRLAVLIGSGLSIPLKRPSWLVASERTLGSLASCLFILLKDSHSPTIEPENEYQKKYIDELSNINKEKNSDKSTLVNISNMLNLIRSEIAGKDGKTRISIEKEYYRVVCFAEVVKKSEVAGGEGFSEAFKSCENLRSKNISNKFIELYYLILIDVFGKRNGELDGVQEKKAYSIHAKLYRDFKVRQYLTLNFDLEIERYLYKMYEKTNRDNVDDDLTFWHAEESNLSNREDVIRETHLFSLNNTTFIDNHSAKIASAAVEEWDKNSIVAHLHGRVDEPKSIVLHDTNYRELYHPPAKNKFGKLDAANIALTSTALLFLGTELSEHDVLLPLRRLVASLDGKTRPLIAVLPSEIISQVAYAGEKTGTINNEKIASAKAKDAIVAYRLRENYGVNTVFYGDDIEEYGKESDKWVAVSEKLNNKLTSLFERSKTLRRETIESKDKFREDYNVPSQGEFINYTRHALKSDLGGKGTGQLIDWWQPTKIKRKIIAYLLEKEDILSFDTAEKTSTIILSGMSGAGSGRVYHAMQSLLKDKIADSSNYFYFTASTSLSFEFASVMENLTKFIDNVVMRLANTDDSENRKTYGDDFIAKLDSAFDELYKIDKYGFVCIVFSGVDQLLSEEGRFISADYRLAFVKIVNKVKGFDKKINIRIIFICEAEPKKLETLIRIVNLSSINNSVEMRDWSEYINSKYLESNRALRSSNRIFAEYKSLGERNFPFIDFEGFGSAGVKLETDTNVIAASDIKTVNSGIRIVKADDQNYARYYAIEPFMLDGIDWFHHSIYSRLIQVIRAEDDLYRIENGNNYISHISRWFQSEQELVELFSENSIFLPSSVIDILHSQLLFACVDWDRSNKSGSLKNLEDLGKYVNEFCNLVNSLHTSADDGKSNLILRFIVDSTGGLIRNNEKYSENVVPGLLRLLAISAMPVEKNVLIAYTSYFNTNTVDENQIVATLDLLCMFGFVYRLNCSHMKGERYAVGKTFRKYSLSTLALNSFNSGEQNFFQSNLYNVYPRDLPVFDGTTIGKLFDRVEWLVGESELSIDCTCRETWQKASFFARTAFGVIRNVLSQAIVCRAHDQLPEWEGRSGRHGSLDRFFYLTERLNRSVDIITKLSKKIEENMTSTHKESGFCKGLPLYPDELSWLYNERGVAALAYGNLYDAHIYFSNASLPKSGYQPTFSTCLRLRLNQCRLLVERGKIFEAKKLLSDLKLDEQWLSRNSSKIYDDFSSDEFSIIVGLNAWISQLQAAYVPALDLYNFAIETMAKRQRHRFCALASINVADIHIANKDYKRAATIIARGNQFADRGQDEEVRAYIKITNAKLLVRQGLTDQIEAAQSLLLQAEQFGRRLGSVRVACSTNLINAELQLKQKNYVEATEIVSKALSIATLNGLQLLKNQSLTTLGNIQFKRGDIESGRIIVRRARHMADRSGYVSMRHRCDTLLSKYFASDN